MRPRWISFTRTRPGRGLMTWRRRHGGRMALGPTVLLLFSLAAPGTADALQFDTYSLSAFIESEPPGSTRAGASFTATAQDFSLSFGFGNQTVDLNGNIVRLGCSFDSFPANPCRPGASVSASAHSFLSDVDINTNLRMVLGGQGIPGCDDNRLPIGRGEPGFPGGTLCATALGQLSFGSAVLPPFVGAPPGHLVPDGMPADLLNVTVASTFSVNFGATIWQNGPCIFTGPDTAPSCTPTRPIDGVGFTGTGPAQFDLEWQPDTGTWLPLFAEGRIDVVAPTPTPEPTTLLLFATTAGLSLTRWYRRRGYTHAA